VRRGPLTSMMVTTIAFAPFARAPCASSWLPILTPDNYKSKLCDTVGLTENTASDAMSRAASGWGISLL